MCDVLILSKYIINKCTKENKPISNFQLQKILYFIQGNSYKFLNRAMFNTPIEAWKHDVVITDVYNLYHVYGQCKICETYNDLDNEFMKITLDEKIVIDKIVNKYRSLDIWDLITQSHEKGSPWNKVYMGYKTIIPESIIRDYFVNKI